MKKSIVRMRKGVPLTFLALVLSIVMVSVGRVSPIPIITQANPVTTVYLDLPTINGTAEGQEFNVSIMIRDASNVYAWQTGLTFNPDLLNCTGFFVGEFLPSEGPTYNMTGTINNTAGVVWPPFGCTFLGECQASGDGRLAYATFKVKTLGVSDIHLSNVKVLRYRDDILMLIPVNIIDVYTVVLDATSHTVVTVSNSTDTVGGVPSGLYSHAFNLTLKELSFNVTGPHVGFSNVTIPMTLLPPPEDPYIWAVMIDGKALSIEKIIKSENTTHTSLYFTYGKGLHTVQITTRFMFSTISIALSEESISLGKSVTISGAIDPARSSVTVTIHNRTKGDVEWDTLTTEETDQNGEYTYEWTPRKIGTYEVMASWEGDNTTLGAESAVLTLKVKGEQGIPLEVVAVVVVAIIVIVAIVVYFVKIRKPKS